MNRQRRPTLRLTALAALAALALTMLLGSAAFAAPQTKSVQPGSDLWAQWQVMQEKLVSAKDLISGEVSDGFNPIGQIRDLVLTPDRTEVQYILYETPFPYSAIDPQRDGFVAFDRVALERDLGYGLKVRFDENQRPSTPEMLKLTASEADHRLASNMLGEPIYFDGDDWRNVEDMLIDRDTGKVTHYVIDMNPDSLFNENPLAVPAGIVEVDKSGLTTASVALAELDSMQEYDVRLL